MKNNIVLYNPKFPDYISLPARAVIDKGYQDKHLVKFPCHCQLWIYRLGTTIFCPDRSFRGCKDHKRYGNVPLSRLMPLLINTKTI